MSTPAPAPTAPAAQEPGPVADRIGRVLLALCSISTLVALADGIVRVLDSPPEFALTEFWRTTAYLVFAGLWALLAVSPRGHRGLWELLLLQKTLVTVHALLNLDLPRGVQTAWVDASLVVFTAVALVLCRGWLSWRPRSA